MKEKDLRQPVEKWLEYCGYWVIHEILIGGYCDILGVRFETRIGRRIPNIVDTIAIELKLTNLSQALSQAKTYSHYVTRAYVAMPEDRINHMRGSTIAKVQETGIGLISVKNHLVTVVLKAPVGAYYSKSLTYPEWNKRHKRNLWRRTKRYR